MDCSTIEERLSEYIESSLPDDEMGQVANHLNGCLRCSSLFREMQSIISVCHNYTTFEMNPDFLERILLRTSGRPRTRTFKERLHQNLIRPLFNPRFAFGAGLASMFVVLMLNYVLPQMSGAISVLSPPHLFQMMDKGVQQVYGKGLKAYDKKNEWQAQYDNFKNSTLGKLRFMIEQIEVPVEGRKKSVVPTQEKTKPSGETSSRLFLWPA
jgi:hypothetical protein